MVRCLNLLKICNGEFWDGNNGKSPLSKNSGNNVSNAYFSSNKSALLGFGRNDLGRPAFLFLPVSIKKI